MSPISTQEEMAKLPLSWHKSYVYLLRKKLSHTELTSKERRCLQKMKTYLQRTQPTYQEYLDKSKTVTNFRSFFDRVTAQKQAPLTKEVYRKKAIQTIANRLEVRDSRLQNNSFFFLGKLAQKVGSLMISVLGVSSLLEAHTLEDRRTQRVASYEVVSNISTYAAHGTKAIEAALSKVPTISPALTKAIIVAGKILAGISWIFMLYASMYRYKEVLSLDKKLLQFLQNEGLTTEEKYLGALNLLRDQIQLIQKDHKKIRRKIHSLYKRNTSPAEIEKMKQKWIAKALQKKVANFINQAGVKSFLEVVKKADLAAEELEQKRPEKAKKLIQTVRKEIDKQKKFYRLCILSATLGILALIALHFCTGGISTLFGVLGYVAISIYLGASIESYWDKRKITPQLQKLWDISPPDIERPMPLEIEMTSLGREAQSQT